MNEDRSIAARIRDKLHAAFSPLVLEIEDDSARHAGHAGARAGGQSHFKVRIVSPDFAGLSRVERQRKVYAVLKDEFAMGVHALQLDTRTPDEANP